MKKTVKILSLMLCVILALTAFPASVYADDSPTLTVESVSLTWAGLNWTGSYSGKYSYVNATVQKSYDNNSWSDFETENKISWNSGYMSVSLNAKEGAYFRVKTDYVYDPVYSGDYEYDYDDEDERDYYIKNPPQTQTTTRYSNSVFVSPNLDDMYYNIESYCDTYEKSPELELYFSGDYANYIDGFIIYKSVNGGNYKYYTTIGVNSYTAYTGSSYEYTVPFDAPSKTGYLASFRIYPYYTANSTVYQSSKYSQADASYVSDDFVTLTTKQNKVEVKIKKIDGAQYKIDYQQYNIKKKKYSGTKTVRTASTKYSIKNNSKNTALSIQVTPCWGSVEGSSSYNFSHEGMTLLRGAKKSKNKKIKVINVKGKKNKTSWTETLSKKDKKIIKNFFKKKYKNKKVSREEKALYAFNWIHSKVKYDYKYTTGNLEYTEAIFKKKKGQCLQYNGAMAKVLTYLGYETRIIEGTRRGNIQHYWCEVKLNGRWYLVETGNEGKNGGWEHFVELYGDGQGYVKNKKDAKD